VYLNFANHQQRYGFHVCTFLNRKFQYVHMSMLKIYHRQNTRSTWPFLDHEYSNKEGDNRTIITEILTRRTSNKLTDKSAVKWLFLSVDFRVFRPVDRLLRLLLAVTLSVLSEKKTNRVRLPQLNAHTSVNFFIRHSRLIFRSCKNTLFAIGIANRRLKMQLYLLLFTLFI